MNIEFTLEEIHKTGNFYNFFYLVLSLNKKEFNELAKCYEIKPKEFEYLLYHSAQYWGILK